MTEPMSGETVQKTAETTALGARTKWVWWVVALFVLGVGFLLRDGYYHGPYGHPDEAITVEVVGHMRQSGDWDTNWAKAPKLESGLRYDQYNFSSHIYATFWFYRLVKVLPGLNGWRSADAGFWVYRFFSVLLATVAVWQTLRLGTRAGGWGVGVVAAAFAAVAPLLVQDAHYSRPEAFVTALMLAAVALCWPGKELRVLPVVAGGLVIGLLVACKISMLLIAWLPLATVWFAQEAERGKRWMVGGGAMLAIVAGFVIGVPGAVVHPEVFVSGIKHLMEQYAGVHPPHSHVKGGPVADMMWRYFAGTLGWPVMVAGVAGFVVLIWRRRWMELVMLGGPVVLFAGYFATRAVFFERNLSHVLPLFLIVAAMGAVAVAEWVGQKAQSPKWVVVSAVAVLLAMHAAMVSAPLVAIEFSGEGTRRHTAYETALRAEHPGTVWKESLLVNEGPLSELTEHFKASQEPVLMRVSDYNDEWTAFNLGLLANRFDAKPVGEFSGSLSSQPTSTLLTYLRPRERYFLVTGLKKK